MKRSRDDSEYVSCARQKTDHTMLSTKRKIENDDDRHSAKRYRVENELLDEKRKNREMQQCVNALLQKIASLEYMLQMFQRNETIASNRLIKSY